MEKSLQASTGEDSPETTTSNETKETIIDITNKDTIYDNSNLKDNDDNNVNDNSKNDNNQNDENAENDNNENEKNEENDKNDKNDKIDKNDKFDKNDKIDNDNNTKRSKIEFAILIFGLMCAVFLATLDQLIVSTALPKIASEFNSLSQIPWIGTAYLLTVTSFQPMYGKLSDIFGRKSTFLFAILVFESGSLLCGAAPNMIVLILARAISGVGGGGIIGLVVIVISDTVEIKNRGKYTGLIGSIYAFSSVIGPLLGGVFTDHVTWRWCFYINLPLGFGAVMIVIFLLKLPKVTGSLIEKFKRIDLIGVFLVVTSTVSVLLPLNWGGNDYAWNSPIVISLFIVGGLGYLAFAYVETKFAVEPIVPPYLFNRYVASCFLVNFTHGTFFFGCLFYLPIYFEIVKGDSAIKSGEEMLPYYIAVVLTVMGSGYFFSYTSKIPHRLISMLGTVLMTVGIGLISTWTESPKLGQEIGYMGILGIGIGLVIQSILLYCQSIVETKDIAVATSLLMFFRSIGGTFGIAIVGAIFNNRLINNLNKVLPTSVNISTIRNSAYKMNELPDSLKKPIIHAFVNAISRAYMFLVPMGIICFFASWFIGDLQPVVQVEEEEVKSKEVEVVKRVTG